MRVLITCLAGHGHLLPMVTTGWALRAAGHEVLLATGGQLEALARTGLHGANVAPGLDFTKLLPSKDMGAAFRSSKADNQVDGDPADHPVIRLFTGLANGMVDGLVELALNWRPDVVVHEQMQLIGALAAAKAGAPSVALGIGLVHDQGGRAGFFESQLPIFQRYGLDTLPDSAARIEVGPPSMGGTEDAWRMRYVPFNGGGVLPDWLFVGSGRPRITVTLGTVVPHLLGMGPIGGVIEAAKQIEAEFVLAMGGADTSVFGGLPENVRIADWVPLNALLATSSAVIHHGGSGTTLTALDAGIPQLIVPQGADQPMNAAAAVRRGLALSAEDDEVDTALIGRLLEDAMLRSTAQDVRTEMHAMPSPAELVSRIESLTG